VWDSVAKNQMARTARAIPGSTGLFVFVPV
jgi:hypothetical protein